MLRSAESTDGSEKCYWGPTFPLQCTALEEYQTLELLLLKEVLNAVGKKDEVQALK